MYEALRARDAMLCTADTDKGDPPPLVATAELGYLRLRREAYSDSDLQGWVKRIAAQPWTRAYVYFKHEDEAAGPQVRRALRRALGGAAEIGQGGAMTTGKSPRRKAQPKKGPALPKALQAYSAKRAFEATPEPAPAAGARPPRPAALRRPAARRAPPALRFPARGRRRAQVVGGPEGAVAQPRGQAARGPDRGPHVRVRVLRRGDPREAVRGGRGDRLGLRRVFARRGPGSTSSTTAPRPSAASLPAWRRASSASSSAA